MAPLWLLTQWRNGSLIGSEQFAVSANDRSLTHGLGLFETLLAIDGQAIALSLHLDRMRRGAGRFGWELSSADEEGIRAGIVDLLDVCDLKRGRARVKVVMTAGGGDLRVLTRGSSALLMISAAPAHAAPESIALVTASFPRNELSPLAGIKCLSYAENLIALDQARQAGADEALFYNTRDELCEATTSNVFLVRVGRIFTPPLGSGCLPGTMRERVLDYCRRTGVDVVEGDLRSEDVEACDAAFVSSAIRGVVPVSKIDGRVLPECPGEIVGLLREADL